MKVKHIILILALVAGGFSFTSMADDDAGDKIRAAVMKVYNEALAKNPEDYNTRFARAMQLYYNGDYDKSLIDASMVIEQTPESEKEQLYDALILRSKLYDFNGNYTAEQADLQRAFAIEPNNLAGVDLIAKLALKQNDLTTAENNFRVILRQSPRNYDALYGLAQVEVKRNNYQKAQEYAEEAVKLFSTEPQVYVNRADIFSKMGQYRVAAQDLILAMSVGNNTRHAVNALMAMSDTHYDEVMDALRHSIDNAPRVASFHYLSASIAKDHQHYAQALKYYNNMIANDFSDDASVFLDAAECQFHLMQFADALNNVNKAIEKDAKNPDAYVLKARILEHQDKGGNYLDAQATLAQGATVKAKHSGILLAQARLMIAQRQNEQAAAVLTQLLASNPKHNEALLLRGWVNKYRLNNPEAALSDFGMILHNGNDMESLKGFALHELNRDDEARAWAQDIITAAPLPGGKAYAVAAALLSDIGDNEQAVKFLESALANGYGSLFEIKENVDPYVNLKLVRRHADFKGLLNRYPDNFNPNRPLER